MILVVTGYHLVIIVVRIQEIEAKTETRVRQTQGDQDPTQNGQLDHQAPDISNSRGEANKFLIRFKTTVKGKDR